MPLPSVGAEDKNMNTNMEKKNDEAVSPVIATILMVAITVVLAGVLYVWANSLASDQPEAGSLNNFDAEDASAFLSGATDDTMIKLEWTCADYDLSWSMTSIKLSVNGAAPITCEVAINSNGADCMITQTGDSDSSWETDETIYIIENGADICTSSCDIDITIMYDGQVLSGTTAVMVD